LTFRKPISGPPFPFPSPTWVSLIRKKNLPTCSRSVRRLVTLGLSRSTLFSFPPFRVGLCWAIQVFSLSLHLVLLLAHLFPFPYVFITRLKAHPSHSCGHRPHFFFLLPLGTISFLPRYLSLCCPFPQWFFPQATLIRSIRFCYSPRHWSNPPHRKRRCDDIFLLLLHLEFFCAELMISSSLDHRSHFFPWFFFLSPPSQFFFLTDLFLEDPLSSRHSFPFGHSRESFS